MEKEYKETVAVDAGYVIHEKKKVWMTVYRKPDTSIFYTITSSEEHPLHKKKGDMLYKQIKARG